MVQMAIRVPLHRFPHFGKSSIGQLAYPTSLATCSTYEVPGLHGMRILSVA